MKFITFGIHTRLHYLIKRNGGLDKEVRRKWFETKFGFDKETIDLVLMYNVEDSLKENTIEEIKQLIIKKNSNDSFKSTRALRNLTSTLNLLCCNSNMLDLGNYFRY
jgi:hypothetical protein